MNRIILIGNGFDLAHGMQTSYQQFLNDFWSKTISKIQETSEYKSFENEDLYIENVPQMWPAEKSFNSLINTLKHSETNYKLKNSFINLITEKKRLKNWVDIEEEYYTLLKHNLNNPDDEYIDNLNLEFKRVKDLLEEYLNEQQKHKKIDLRIKSTIKKKIYENLNFKDFTEKPIKQKVNEIYQSISKDIQSLVSHSKTLDNINKNKDILRRINFFANEQEIKKELRNILLSEEAKVYFDIVPKQILLLNFNYTDTQWYYEDSISSENINVETIHIHGNLHKQDNNPIIFGFGDEIDEDYKKIEKLNNNKYLENIKSIKYLETDNYRKLIEFLNSEEYQIFIFGHSCGISDRTLLNAIFENNNCVSIKPFYHQKNEIENNYSDIIRNISRNFNNKLEMRNKVVNKNYCEPLT